ncbi:MAG: hypothetical protein LBD10_13145 [Desulfobulbus sp.]|jgi:uncharacterized membrane protein YGL010W|uniref:hypothetical protein n=1 Tax=Desulfobulbus sp. TaxID=895 RepID=UPI00284F501E|nr:hypothetical protein [Desulfobulbus sp.]MDR2551135.1 hypothetical protein [Desulfobulbus sp.]
MSEYKFFLLHKLLVLSVNILVLTALFIAMYRASLFPDDFTPTFFKTIFLLLVPTFCLGFIGKRLLGKRRPALI